MDILAGWIYSPNAIASAPIVTAGKKLAVIMNAGTAHITNLSPYYVRTSFSMWHAGLRARARRRPSSSTPRPRWSATPTSRPARTASPRSSASFEANGGKVIDEIPMGGAGAVPDFTPFFQRAKDKKPDVFFVFVPAGDHAAAVVKTYAALGMREAGIRLIGPGDITQDTKLQAMGAAAVGLVTMHHYHADLDNPENKRFVEAWKKEYGADTHAGLHGRGRLRRHGRHRPRGPGAQGQDRRGPGARGAQAAGSSRARAGRSSIDPATRDIVMNEYLSEVVMKDGRVFQKVIGKIDAVKDACKEQKIGPCAGN